MASLALEHLEECEVGPERCRDCRLARDPEAISAIDVARRDYEHYRRWLRSTLRAVCIYCGDTSSHEDHMVPRPWSGDALRPHVPTVPSCAECNGLIGDTPIFTVAGRAEHIAEVFRRRHCKPLAIIDHDEEYFQDMMPRFRKRMKAQQEARQLLRHRLMVLDSGGTPMTEDMDRAS